MGRGRADTSTAIIEAAVAIVAECKPLTVRGVVYKLFTLGLVSSMEPPQYRKAQRLILAAREEGVIPWNDVVDDGRTTQRPGVYAAPRTFARVVENSWRADPWSEQDVRVEIISEKSTVAGVLAPVLHEFALPSRSCKGFTSATAAWQLAGDSLDDARPLICLGLGDHDASGRYMTDVDLPERLQRYGGAVTVVRIALVEDDLDGLPHFPLKIGNSKKKGDPRAPWFRERFGEKCYELDALDPVALRQRVEDHVRGYIDWTAWERVATANRAVAGSLKKVMAGWTKKATGIFAQEQECP